MVQDLQFFFERNQVVVAAVKDLPQEITEIGNSILRLFGIHLHQYGYGIQGVEQKMWLQLRRQHLHSCIYQLRLQQIFLLFRLLYPFEIMIGVHDEDHCEVNKEIKIHYQDEPVYAFLKAVLLDAEGSHQYSLNVKDESDYKPYKDGEDGVHDKDPHPGIFFVQKALCADRNKSHVTDNNDQVD